MAIKHPVFCVCLTGGIGSGKTTVANFFVQLGITVIDADAIAHEIISPGAEGYGAIVAHFGKDILMSHSTALDRQKLRKIIFQNPAEKSWLENTLHPVIVQTMRERLLRVTSPYCLVVIPLFAETSLPLDFINRVCVVDAPEALQRQWAAQRDQVSPAEIELIMATQAPRETRLALADDVITNNQSLSALEAEVKKLHTQYLQMASV